MKYQAVCLCLVVGCIGSVQSPKEPITGNNASITTRIPLDNRQVDFGVIDATPVIGKQGNCAEGMVLVDGEFCTKVKQECKVWKDHPGPFARCAEYYPSVCTGTRVHKKFCIDKNEYTKPGETLPASNVSWTSGKVICEAQHKRLCTESEWTFSCEGEDMFPYTTGLNRPDGVCNIDVEKGLLHNKKKVDLRVSDASMPACISPFGVVGMNGNVDEFVVRDMSPGPYKSAMKGGWWAPVRDRCRPATTAHNEFYYDIQSGVRCCEDTQ